MSVELLTNLLPKLKEEKWEPTLLTPPKRKRKSRKLRQHQGTQFLFSCVLPINRHYLVVGKVCEGSRKPTGERKKSVGEKGK